MLPSQTHCTQACSPGWAVVALGLATPRRSAPARPASGFRAAHSALGRPAPYFVSCAVRIGSLTGDAWLTSSVSAKVLGQHIVAPIRRLSLPSPLEKEHHTTPRCWLRLDVNKRWLHLQVASGSRVHRLRSRARRARTPRCSHCLKLSPLARSQLAGGCCAAFVRPATPQQANF